MPDKKIGAVLVVGGGIAGMQASLDLAESGFKVYLVDKSPALGGRMAQLDKTFPTNDCAMCTLAPKMVDAGRHINVERLTYSEIVDVQREPGNFQVTIRKKARSVDPEKCAGCGECTLQCPVRYKAYSPALETMEAQILPEDKEMVKDILSRYQYKKAPLIPVLQAINAQFNYLPEEVLHYLSSRLGIPLAHILRVATFYTVFSLEPKGKYLISVCQGTSCFVRGADMLLGRLNELLGIKPGETSPDGKFSLETVRCIGCCALAPALKVGGRVYPRVRSIEVANILKGY